jgi:hypothetical protein
VSALIFRFLMTYDTLVTLISFKRPSIGKTFEFPTALNGILERTSRIKRISIMYLKAIFLGSKISSPYTLDIYVILKFRNISIINAILMNDSTIISPALAISRKFQDIYKGMVIELYSAIMIMRTSQYSLK